MGGLYLPEPYHPLKILLPSTCGEPHNLLIKRIVFLNGNIVYLVFLVRPRTCKNADASWRQVVGRNDNEVNAALLIPIIMNSRHHSPQLAEAGCYIRRPPDKGEPLRFTCATKRFVTLAHSCPCHQHKRDGSHDHKFANMVVK